MDINTHVTADGVTIEVAGQLVAGGPEFALTVAVRRAIDAGHRAIIVNLAEVSTLDAAGIGAIISAFVAARDRRVPLVLDGASPRVRVLLTLTGLWPALTAVPRRRRPARDPAQRRSRWRALVETPG